MTRRREFRLIASTIATVREDGNNLDALVARMCVVLRRENPRFDAQRFRNACEPVTPME